MNIVYYLLGQFFNEERFNLFFMVLLSFVINIFQTNGISFITARIIEEVYNFNKKLAFTYFKYFIIVSSLYVCLSSFYKHYQNKILTKLRQWMRHQLLKMILLFNNENYSEMNFTKLNSPINRISSVSFMVFNDIITYLLPNLTFLLIVYSYFLYKHFFFGGTFIFGNLFLILYFWNIWKNMLEHNEEYEKFVGETEAYMIEVLNNIDKIIYRGQTKQEIKVFNNKTEKSINKAMEFYSNVNFHCTMLVVILYVILFVSIGQLMYLFFKKKVDVTVFITFFTILLLYRDKMISVIQQIPDFVEFLGRSDTVLKHFQNIEDKIPSLFENKAKRNGELPFHKIRFENIAFKYTTNNTYLFDNFNIDLNTENKIIGITGLSGNGKSTFAKLLLKMYTPERGKIYIDGEDICHLDADYIRKNITYVNQSSKLFDKKVVENMLYGCNDLDVCNRYLNEMMGYEKIKELYKKMDIYTKNSGSLGENLSGGQRQVVNILSGLINPCEILILDEPTNALDIELKREVLQLIKECRKHKNCIIIITHDNDVFPLFDEKIEI
jgi:ABC-type bacteriocin/lantibiotic exporter with double-glycine peptidase domain